MIDWSERGNIRKRGPRGNPSARTQLFAADRRTSQGSKKEEAFRRPTEAPKENRKKHHITVRDLLRFLTSSRRSS